MSDGNGEIRVPFGEGESQHVPLSWAAHILTKLHDEQPLIFGKYLTEAVTGLAVRVSRVKPQ